MNKEQVAEEAKRIEERLSQYKYSSTIENTLMKFKDDKSEENALGMRNQLNTNTIWRKDGLMAHNFIMNEPDMKYGAYRDFEKREGIDLQDGLPAVIVGAGPSLSKNIHVLDGFDTAHVFTTGRRLSRVLKYTRPEACFVLDPLSVEKRFLGDSADKTTIDLDGIPLIASGCTSPAFIQGWKKHNGGDIYWLTPFHPTPMGRWYYNRRPEFGILNTAGNVASLATAFALTKGMKLVALIGCDFSYREIPFGLPKGISHKPGELDDGIGNLRVYQSYGMGLEGGYAEFWSDAPGVPWGDNDLRFTVFDNPRVMSWQFMAYVQAFYEMAKAWEGKAKIVNCTEGGALYYSPKDGSPSHNLQHQAFDDFRNEVESSIMTGTYFPDERIKSIMYRGVPEVTDEEADILMKDFFFKEQYKEMDERWR